MISCGLDIGSTNVKAVLAGEDGRTLWVKSVPTPHVNDGLGTTTDAAALVVLLEDLIIEGWRAAGGGKPLAAISSAGVGEDGVCADEDLTSLGLVIAWHRQAGAGGGGALPRALQLHPRRLPFDGRQMDVDAPAPCGGNRWRDGTGSRWPIIPHRCGAARPS